MLSLEAWQAWDLLLKLSGNIHGEVPLEQAFKLAQHLGYDMLALAELLPELTLGVVLGLQDRPD